MRPSRSWRCATLWSFFSTPIGAWLGCELAPWPVIQVAGSERVSAVRDRDVPGARRVVVGHQVNQAVASNVAKELVRGSHADAGRPAGGRVETAAEDDPKSLMPGPVKK